MQLLQRRFLPTVSILSGSTRCRKYNTRRSGPQAASLGHSSQSANTRLHKQRFITGPFTFSVCLPETKPKRNSNSPPGYKRRMHSLEAEIRRCGDAGPGKINKPTGKSPCHWGPKGKQCKAQQFSVFSLQFSVSSSLPLWKVDGKSAGKAGRAAGSAALRGTSVSRIVVANGGWGSGFWDMPLAAGRKTSALRKSSHTYNWKWCKFYRSSYSHKIYWGT